MRLSDLANTLFPDSSPSVVILSLHDISGQTRRTLKHWLHAEELTRLAEFAHKKRNREWLGGRLCSKQALRLFLHHQTDVPFLPEHQQARVASTEAGRPYFAPLEGIEFSFPELSISHSSEFATAMACRNHCGIDIQYPAENLHRVQQRFCTDDEEDLLRKSLSHLSLLLQLTLLWSGKEAVKKMLSPAGIPGFHELTLHKIKPQGQSDVILYFSRSNKQNSFFKVAAGILNNSYTLALCCLPPIN